MAKEVDVERLHRPGADRGKLRAHRVDRQQRARQRAKPARIRHGDRQRTPLDTSHRRLNDWQFNPEECFERAHLLQSTPSKEETAESAESAETNAQNIHRQVRKKKEL